MNLKRKTNKNAAVIVAHPDDETLWAGGTILIGTDYNWHIISLCRGDDPERSPRFFNALTILEAEGKMGNLDDGPEQKPLPPQEIGESILSLMPCLEYDIIVTHSPDGEYTRHKRHEEIGQQVIQMWKNKKLSSRQLWLFAYEDGGGEYLPRPIKSADRFIELERIIWEKKYSIITEVYNFSVNSFEAKTVPLCEGFWCFDSRQKFFMEVST
ncbi:MAG: PIG-L family deacetylase [Thermodesulfobacteriota bacterium]|nr:PIG-L family deacetylase [Thermodesulfobacteriota bacterium]